MNDRIYRINRILSIANRCFYISRDLTSSGHYDLTKQNEFLRFSGLIYFTTCVVELAKLFQEKPGTQKQNIYSFIKNLDRNNTSISADDIERWKGDLQSLDSKVVGKIESLRNKLFAHLDDDYLDIIRESPLSFKEIQQLLDVANDIVGELNDKLETGVAGLEYMGSPTELQSAYDHLTKYRELLEIEKKNIS